MLWTRFMSMSVIFSMLVSKPSRMKSGMFASLTKLLLRADVSIWSDEAPRNCMEAMTFGFEPACRFSMTSSEGSMFLRLSTMFALPTRLRSSDVMVWTAPVKESFFRVKIPVTTASLRVS